MLEQHGNEMSTVLSSTIVRLLFAAILGGLIGLEREHRHKPAGLRTNMFICFGAAMFTVLSDQLAFLHSGDHTRIAAQIIPGIGFIGAGSILHSRGSVVGLTTASTLFTVASIGMAAGGGLYLTAIFATGLILIALALLGKLETRLSLKSQLVTYEVLAKDAETLIGELNRILDTINCKMQELHLAKTDTHARAVFDVVSSQQDQGELNVLLHQSSVFANISTLATQQHE
jgi:putative Mg2+ transporter-C (MgtC) family protein